MATLSNPLPPTEAEQRTWLQTHLTLLSAEVKLEREQTSLIRSKASPSLLASHGLALLELGASAPKAGPGGKRLIELERPAHHHSDVRLPPHTFRSGDVVRVCDATAAAGAAKGKKKSDAAAASDVNLGAVVFRVTEKTVVISVKGDAKGEQAQLPARINLIKDADEAVHRRMEQTLLRLARILRLDLDAEAPNKAAAAESSSSSSEDEAASTSTSTLAPSPLILSLLGLTQPKWSPPPTQAAPLFDANLNASQRAALTHALTAQHFALLHGPPGTGKTSTVSELVLQLALAPGRDVSERKRVLVCAASNLAADNVLARVLEKGAKQLKEAGIGATRVGHPARVLGDLSSSTLDYQSLHSSEGALLTDVRTELSAALTSLAPPAAVGAGNKSSSWRGTASSKPLRGSARKEAYEQIRSLRREARKRERGVSKSVLAKAGIVVATCHGAGSRALMGRFFDYIVVDEACQALEAAVWIPILQRGHQESKLILAGDHLQLPPTVKGYRHSTDPRRMGSAKKKRGKSTKEAQGTQAAQVEPQEVEAAESDSDEGDSPAAAAEFEAGDSSDDAELAFQASKLSTTSSLTSAERPKLRPPRSLETTLFSRLLGMYGPGCKALLEEQYRMNRDIMAFPSDALYEGRLKANESCAERRLVDLPGFEGEEGVEADEELWGAPLVFYDTAGADMFEQEGSGEASSSSKGALLSESKSNANEADLVLKHVTLLLSHGVPPSSITVLAPYASQVSLLAKVLSPHPDVEVGTVDSQQGRENDVVIISLVRSNEKGEVGFLREKRRLNVAMTRAKRQLCVVGDSSTVEKGGEYLKRWMDHLAEKALVEVVLV